MSTNKSFPQLIGIAGHAGAGKDTAARAIKYYIEHEALANIAPKVEIISFAGPLKHACAHLFGFPSSDFNDQVLKNTKVEFWGMSPRETAQFVGTEMFRKWKPNFWISRMQHEIDKYHRNYTTHLIIPDVRFQEEYAWIIANGGVIIYISRPEADGKVGIENHSSEAGFHIHSEDIAKGKIHTVRNNFSNAVDFKEFVTAMYLRDIAL
jgi:hypothetical protein